MTYYGNSYWTCATFSLLYLEQQGYRSNYPNSSHLVSAHSRDGSMITSLLKTRHSVPTYWTHPKQCVFPVSHPSLCFTALLSDGLISCNNKGEALRQSSLERMKNYSKKNDLLTQGRKGYTCNWSQGSPSITELFCLYMILYSACYSTWHYLKKRQLNSN